MRLPGLRLFCTGRDTLGMYELRRMDSGPVPRDREALSQFWKHVFTSLGKGWKTDDAARTWQDLARGNEALADSFAAHLADLGRSMAAMVRRKGVSAALDQSFWRNMPPMLRPLASLLQLRLENERYSDQAVLWALASVELVAGCLGRSSSC